MYFSKTTLVRAIAAAAVAATLIFAGAAGYGLPGGDRASTSISK